MRDIQARRRRKIVGPTSGDRAPVGHDPAHGSPGPEPVDVGGWENEGGAGQSDPDDGALEAPGPPLRRGGQDRHVPGASSPPSDQ